MIGYIVSCDVIVNQPARAAFRSISTRFSVNDWRRLLAARSSVYFFSFRLGKIIRRHEVTYRPYFGSRPSSSWNQGQYSTKVVLCERNYLSSWMTRLHCANYSKTVRSLVEKFAMPIVHRLVHSFRVSHLLIGCCERDLAANYENRFIDYCSLFRRVFYDLCSLNYQQTVHRVFIVCSSSLGFVLVAT